MTLSLLERLRALNRRWSSIHRNLQDATLAESRGRFTPMVGVVVQRHSNSIQPEPQPEHDVIDISKSHQHNRRKYYLLLQQAARLRSADFPRIFRGYHARYIASPNSINYALLWTSHYVARIPAPIPPLYPSQKLHARRHPRRPPRIAEQLCDAALDVSNWMAEVAGFAPSLMTYRALIAHCTAAVRPEKAANILQKAIQAGHPISDTSMTQIINALGRSRDLGHAIELFNMSSKSSYSHMAMVSGFASNGYMDKAVAMFDRMRSRGIPRHPQMFQDLLARAAIANNVEATVHVLDADDRPVPRRSILYRIGYCLGQGGRADRAWKLHEDGEVREPRDRHALFLGLAEALYRQGLEEEGDLARSAMPWSDNVFDEPAACLILARALIVGKNEARSLDELCDRALPYLHGRHGADRHTAQHVLSYIFRILGTYRNLAGIERVLDAALLHKVPMSVRSCRDVSRALVACGVSEKRIDQLIDRLRVEADLHPLDSLRVLLTASLSDGCILRSVQLLKSVQEEVEAQGGREFKHHRLPFGIMLRLRKIALKEGPNIEALADLIAQMQISCPMIMDESLFCRNLELIARTRRWRQFDSAFALVDQAGTTLRGRRLDAAILAATLCDRPRDAMLLLVHGRRRLSKPSPIAYSALLRMCGRLGLVADVAAIYRDACYVGYFPSTLLIADAALAADGDLRPLYEELSRHTQMVDEPSTRRILKAIVDGDRDECRDALLQSNYVLEEHVYRAAALVLGIQGLDVLVNVMLSANCSHNTIRWVCQELERQLLRQKLGHEVAVIADVLLLAGINPQPRTLRIAAEYSPAQAEMTL